MGHRLHGSQRPGPRHHPCAYSGRSTLQTRGRESVLPPPGTGILFGHSFGSRGCWERLNSWEKLTTKHPVTHFPVLDLSHLPRARLVQELSHCCHLMALFARGAQIQLHSNSAIVVLYILWGASPNFPTLTGPAERERISSP